MMRIADVVMALQGQLETMMLPNYHFKHMHNSYLMHAKLTLPQMRHPVMPLQKCVVSRELLSSLYSPPCHSHCPFHMDSCISYGRTSYPTLFPFGRTISRAYPSPENHSSFCQLSGEQLELSASL